MGGFRTHRVNVWTERDPGSPASTAMIDSILFLPEGAAPDVPRPGVVIVPGWARYPYDPLARRLGPLLACHGIAVLSLGLRRRGGEGQLASPSPDSDLSDIKVGLDALAQHGVHASVLVGQDVGSLSAARYVARSGDNRVAAVALVDPIADLHAWLVARVGPTAVERWTRLASQASYENKSDLIRIDVDVPVEGRPPLWIFQTASAFLSWWSPRAALRLPHVLEEVGVPVLAIGTDAHNCAAVGAGTGPASAGVEVVTVARADDIPAAVADWARHVLPRPARPATFELVEAVTDGGGELAGYLTVPAADARSDVAVLVVHGLTTGPFSPMVKQFLPHYVDHGFAALAIETRRSGVRCITHSDPDDDIADIDAFIDLLAGRGYPRVVLVGASLGSQAISRYIAARHHPAVVAAVHLAPTADMPTDLERNVGPDGYAALVAEAHRAVAEGRGGTHDLVYDQTERGPSRFHSTRRTFWRAASWLAWWGPDADTVHGPLMAEVDVPVLLVTGTADDYSDQARIDQLVATAGRSPRVDQIWVGADHGLRGAEGEVTARVVGWLEDHGYVERHDPPAGRPLAGITGRLPGRHVYPDPPGPPGPRPGTTGPGTTGPGTTGPGTTGPGTTGPGTTGP
jgi:dienelactone hydrolase